MSDMPYTINDMRNAISEKHVLWSEHALEKMIERDIRKSEVRECILKGEIIEEYLSDKPFPSCLIFALRTLSKILSPSCLIFVCTDNGRPIHTVCSFDNGVLYIITAYEPTPFKWLDDHKTRRAVQ